MTTQSRARPEPDIIADEASDMFELRVLSGLHQGAALPLFGERWCIGAHEEADLALYDPGVEALHAQLQCIDGKWRVQAQEGLVQNEAGTLLAHIADLAPSVEFSISGIRLCVANVGSVWLEERMEPPVVQPLEAAEQTAAASGDRWRKLFPGALIVLALMLTGSALWPFNEEESGALQRPVDSDKRRLETPHEVHQQLIKMLSERELVHHINLEVMGQQITLQGDVLQEQSALLSRMLERFQTQYETSVLILNRVQVMSSGLPFKIVQIIGGKKAHVVLADGRRIFFGDEVEGLRLTLIDKHRLLFEGKQRYEVNW